MNAEQAQQRLAQIEAFRQELKQLQAEEVLSLEGEQRQRIDEHHRQLLNHFSATLNIDADERSRQLSLGMRAASLFGALALAASLYFLFHQFWDCSEKASKWQCCWAPRSARLPSPSGCMATTAAAITPSWRR